MEVFKMEYLLHYGFNDIEINDIKEANYSFITQKIGEHKNLVLQNLTFLQELGVTNNKDIFKRHVEMFLMDNDAFEKVFNKYDRDDLIERLKYNPDLVEQL